MNEFKGKGWLGNIIFFNVAAGNDPSRWQEASACLTNGCTNYIGNLPADQRRKGIAIYDLWLPRDYSYLKYGRAFWCPFTLGQVIRNLEDINEVVPFKFEIEESPELFKIRLEISKEDFAQRVHFYVLTRVRYLYEYPQSVLFKDAMELSEMEEFSGWSLQSLYNLIVDSIPIARNCQNGYTCPRGAWYDCYHSIPTQSSNQINEILDTKTLKSRLKTVGNLGALNNIYGKISKIPVKIPFDQEMFESLAYWKEPEGLRTRLPYYLANKELHENYSLRIAKVSKDLDFEEEFKIIKEKGSNEDKVVNDSNNLFNKIRNKRWKIIKQEKKEAKIKEREKADSWYAIFNKLHPRGADGRFIKKV